MQLHKLEIKGFKSFADKIIIHFDQGITGIVGPNGCGKSNIVDAIRWVLGEQKTKALRSDKMDNVIFNGTRTRKPLQLAEVSLTFNNNRSLLPTEYSHVTITRRYFRSGESEYLLNNVTCRLKDITNLFLDTGIGSDSYAIIELKMVDDLLNDKDNSRRGLFEEAAGISKFKVRKRETLRKLEDTDGDLARVEDLLHEISKNLKILERQAKQTETYFKLKEEYKQGSVEWATRTVSRHRDSFVVLGKNLETETERKTQLQAQLAGKEAELEKEKGALLGKEKLMVSRQKALNEQVNTIRQYESEKKIKSERLRMLTERVQSLRDQIHADEAQRQSALGQTKRLEGERQQVQQVQQGLWAIKDRVDELKEEYQEQKDRAAHLQRELSSVNASFRTRQDEVFGLRKMVEIKQMQLSSLKQELEKVASDDAAQQANLSAFNENLFELSSQLREKSSQLADLQSSVKDLQEQLEETENEGDAIRQELGQLNRQLDAKGNEFNLTKSLVDNLEGFPEAIKFLQKSIKWEAKMPLVSDILTCPDAYRAALENFLEPVMSYYVVPDEAVAYQAINLLSKAGKGKANFFVLDRFNSFFPKSLLLASSETGMVPAIEITGFDEKYRNLVAHLLDGVYILKHNPETIPAFEGATFLSQNGKLISRQYSLTGGSVGLFEGKRIGRAKNLENLQKDIAQLTAQLRNLTERQNRQKALREELVTKRNSLNTRISQEQKEIDILNREAVGLRARQEQLSLTLRKGSQRREDMLEQVQTLQEEVAEAHPLAEEKGEELKGIEARINHLNGELTAQNEMVTVKSNAFNAENIRFHQQQNRLNSLEQEISFHQSNLEKTQLRIGKNREEMERAQADMAHLTETSEEGDEKLVEMYAEKESIEAGLHEAEKDYYASRGQIATLEKEARDLQRQREMTDALLMEMQNKRNETRLQLSSVKERLAVEFNVDLDQLMESEEVAVAGENGERKKKNHSVTQSLSHALTDEEVKAKVQDLKARLDKIGPINPMAMEAYQEIKERYDFITGQKNDLLDAKNSLLSTISEIDTVAKDTFMEAFNRIRDNFIKVFRSLFSEEDSCDLRLTHPENPLDSTIDIIAKPKGKRPLTINQLSGGEKTLTAISLLFAIYLIKPAPFCIFDEVDAPLDDANIDKFNNIIRKFSDESQFIIVTHNKRTMTSTDIIYGITQTEGDIGVSKVVPVDLRALNEN